MVEDGAFTPVDEDERLSVPRGFRKMLEIPFLEALQGRRSRRFFTGAEIPDGVFAYKSKILPEPLSELERLLVVGACGGGIG